MVAKKKTLRTACAKTKLCKYEASTCPKGPTCTFAHDDSELMPMPDLVKTRMCPRLLSSGVCKKVACSFAHLDGELKELPPPRPKRRPPNAQVSMNAPEVAHGSAEAPAMVSMSNLLGYEPKLLHEKKDRRGSKDSNSAFSQASTWAPAVCSRRGSKFSDMSTQFTADEYDYFASRRVSTASNQEAFLNMEVPIPNTSFPLFDSSALVTSTVPFEGLAARSTKANQTQMRPFYQMGNCRRGGRCALVHGERDPRPMYVGDAEGAKFCPALLSIGVCVDAHCRYIHTQQVPAPASPARPGGGGRGPDCDDAGSDLEDSDSDCSPRYRIPVLSDTSEGQLIVKNTFITVEHVDASPPRRRSV